MVQSSQGLRSTKKKKYKTHNNQKKTTQDTLQQQSGTEDIPLQKKTRTLHMGSSHQ